MSRNSDWSAVTDQSQQRSSTDSVVDFKQESPASTTTETESARILGLDSAYISIPDDAFSRYDELNFGDLYNLNGQSQSGADFPSFFDTNSFDGSSSTSPPEGTLNFDDTPSPVPYSQPIIDSTRSSMGPPPLPAAAISIPASNSTPFRYSFNDSTQTSGFLSRSSLSQAAGRSPQVNQPPVRLQRASSFHGTTVDFPYDLDTLETDFTSSVDSLARTSISKPIPTDHENFTVGETTVKRHRAAKPDNVAACWTSPLCPNNNATDGSHPDPATCGGECAPFLFAIADSPEEMQEVKPEESPIGVVELKSKGRSKKRSETSSRSREPSGRQFAKPGKSSRRASEATTPEDVSPQQDDNDDDEAKGGKGNRVPHNEVEKRYRDKLNIGYEELRMVIPSLRPQVACKTDMEDTGKSNVSKGEILRTAKTYIENMQKREKKLQEQLAYYKNRANDLEADKKCQSCFVLQNYSRMTLSQPQYGRL